MLNLPPSHTKLIKKQKYLAQKRLDIKTVEVKIIDKKPFRYIEKKLREAGLLKTKNIKPYVDANITLAYIDIDELLPLATYVIEDRLKEIKFVHDAILLSQDISTFFVDYYGLFKIYKEGVRAVNQLQWPIRVCPPIVERYKETKGDFKGNTITVILDGLHRVYVAKSLGYRKISAILIENAALPPAFVALGWDKVKVKDTPPPRDKRHEFRINSIEDLVNIGLTHNGHIDQIRYFLYRDLKELCSEGVR